MVNPFKNLSKSTVGLLIGLVLATLLYLLNPLDLLEKASLVLAIAIMMVTWWVSEALPLAVVALVPIVLFPILEISEINKVVLSYANSTIFLFMGGFFISVAIEKWNLHKRFALGIINLTGTNGDRIVLGFIIATGFMSLWLSNTATTMMMYPIALSVIQVIELHHNTGANLKHFSITLMLSIAYASNFALGTIIGTPPNVAYAAHIQDKFNYSIGFTDWMIVFIPLTLLLMLALYLILVKWMYPNNITESKQGKLYIEEELKKIGPLSTSEKRVLMVFLTTVFLWIFKDILNQIFPKLHLDDTIIAMFGGLLLFIVPAGDAKAMKLLQWEDTKNMAWGILLLFGGGIALAKALEDVNLLAQLGSNLANIGFNHPFVMILTITTISVFLSELMSNVAQVIVFSPVVTSIALGASLDPLILGIPMALGASCASMLPMGTPPNAIVFASGKILIKDMMKTGFVLNLVCILFISIFCWFLQPFIISMK